MSTSDKRTLMAVFAHPDDESFGIGGTLARYGAEPDIRVVLLCATRGEAGEISDPGLAIPARLGEAREAELRCAGKALGIDEIHFLGYRDSGMAGTLENQHPQALTMADFEEGVGQIVAHIRRERPDVLVTFDENGGYGHPDHVAIHHMAKEAFAAAADPSRYPEQIQAGLSTHATKKLYYTAIPRRFFLAMVEKLKELEIEVPERFVEMTEMPIGLPDEACTTDVDVREFWEAKQAAIRCHATQLSPDNLFLSLPPEMMRELQAWECFQLAESAVGGDGQSHDLFAGLR